jgi:hypothetical protein
MAGASERLAITATLAGPVFLPRGALHIDSLLAAAVARRDGLPPPLDPSLVVPIEIPVEREPGGRFHLCSSSVCQAEEHELQHTHRRAPIEQYQTIGSQKIRTVDISTGQNKSYRIARPVVHMTGDEIRWYAVGDAAAIRDLLAIVGHVGKRRSVGLGRVLTWFVEPCDGWGGFPVARAGKPLRPLPRDWPGLVSPRLAFGRLSYPYWQYTDEELLASP